MHRILLYTDKPILALGLAAVLADRGGYELTVCSTIEETTASAQANPPDLLLLDQTPAISYAALKGWQHDFFHCPIALWIEEIPLEFAAQAVGCGIRAIISKSLPAEMTMKIFDLLLEGKVWFEKTLSDRLLCAQRVSVTRREGQLMTLLAEGLKNKEIATRLGICEGTVKVYLSRLFEKLHVRDRWELGIFARQNLGGIETHAQGSPVYGPRSWAFDRKLAA
jgi:two-component system nitrate/nitrite response regulator NarP